MPTLVFDSMDLARTEEFLRTHYAPMKIGSTKPRSPAHISSTSTGAVSVDHLAFGFEMTYDVQPLGRICLCDVESGVMADHLVDGWAARETFGPGDLFWIAPPDRPYVGRIEQARYRATLLDHALLDQVATPAHGQAAVRLLDHRPVSVAAGQQLRHAIAHVERHVLGDPGVLDSPLIVATASRYLAACVLAAFPNTAQTAADRTGAGSMVVRRAVEYIETYAGVNISPADIAAAAHITVRGLQYAFRRHLDTTPMAYVRRVRLERAHRDLLAAHYARGDTVTAIAARWGFLHQGRFAAAYRRAYGRAPGRTLRD